MPRRHGRLLVPSIPATRPGGGAGWAGAWPPTAPAHAPTRPDDPLLQAKAPPWTSPGPPTRIAVATAVTHDGDPADVPPDVSDLELWLGAVDLAARHAPDPVNSKRCVNPNCSDPQPYPCFARRLADRSAVRSRWASGLDRADLRSSGSYRSRSARRT